MAIFYVQEVGANNEFISTAIKVKNKAYTERQNVLSSALKRTRSNISRAVQFKLRNMQDLWWQRKAEEM